MIERYPEPIMRRLAALLLLAAVLCACGTKGALYLPPADAQDGGGKRKSR